MFLYLEVQKVQNTGPPPSDVSLLGEFKKFKIPSPKSDVSLLGEFNKFKKFKTPSPNSDVSLLGEFKNFIPSPNSNVSLPGEFKQISPKMMFLYLGSSKNIKCSFFLRSCFFSRPATGLLGRPAAFH